MKVKFKQRNSKMCIMCGLDNEYGVKAPFYTMEDGSVMTVFTYREQHQSYPGRVHGGLISSMLDEMGLRALWAKELCEDSFGVTMSLETKYRRPVPYNEKIIGKGIIVKDTPRFCTAEVGLYDMHGTLLANGVANYIKMDISRIAEAVPHEEMCYLIEDGVTEINFE